MLAKRAVLLAKEEASYSSDPTPDGTNNSFLAINPKIKETSAPAERNVAMKTLSRKASLLGQIFSELTFQLELKGSGTPGTAPRLGDLLEACGCDETVSAGSSVTYTPGSGTMKSVTLYLYLDGLLHKVNGAKGNVKLIAKAGEVALLDFTFKGLWVTPSDASMPTCVYESSTPPTVKAGSLTLNAVTTLVVAQAELDMANEVSLRASLNAATGVGGFEITSRKPILTLDPEAVLVATYNYRTDLLATPRSLSFVIGATAGNKCTVTIPKYNITDIEYGDREGMLINSIKGEATANSDTGNDEFSLNFA